ncbi:MAG: EAL domain-containing protein, partial [Ruminiclostridium sp.]|nr:EAL domain-containing protein [Ruminiclostridium sp.]
TETAANYNQTAMIDNMTKLIDAGISFSLDDFGTGYSNMARVASLPLKIVKLDKTFVDNSNKPRLHIFLKGTIKMLKDMDMEIVVEGIETEQMVEMFSELNCDYIQGYIYSKPVPEKEFVCFIRNALLTA